MTERRRSAVDLLGMKNAGELLDFPGAGHHDRATASCHGLSWATSARFCSLWGGCCQLPLCGSYRACFALSGEGVVSSHSVVATGLVSRHRSEFGTLRAVRFCGLEALAQAILGVLESLQRRSKTARWQAAAQLRNRSLPASLGSFRTAANFLRKPHRCWPRWASWRFRHASSMFYLEPAETPCHPVILSFCHPVMALAPPENRAKVAPKRPMTERHCSVMAPRAPRTSKIVPKRPMTERRRSVMAPRTPENRAKSHRNPLPGRP